MQYTDIVWVKNLLGGTTIEMEAVVGATAVKKGDPVIKGATDDLLIPMTAADQQVVGIATHDAAVGATLTFVPAFPWNVFAIKCDGAKLYEESTDRYIACDFVDFTSGDMRIDPDTEAAGDVIPIALADGETDAEAENVVYCIFTDTVWTTELKN
jgi:hypothetical protein